MKMERLIFMWLGLLFAMVAQAQHTDADPAASSAPEGLTDAVPVFVRVEKAFYKGDSIPHVTLPTFYKYPPMTFKNAKEREKYDRLVAAVKKTLPLAKRVRYTIRETYEYLETLPDEKARMEHIRRVEEGLKRQYGSRIRKLTRSEGRLLVKLIDRECNMTGYHIAKAFIGSFKANMYQSIAFCFGNSLNKHYDPEGDDRYTERIVRMVESGQL